MTFTPLYRVCHAYIKKTFLFLSTRKAEKIGKVAGFGFMRLWRIKFKKKFTKGKIFVWLFQGILGIKWLARPDPQ